jgi:hypothetical protein
MKFLGGLRFQTSQKLDVVQIEEVLFSRTLTTSTIASASSRSSCSHKNCCVDSGHRRLEIAAISSIKQKGRANSFVLGYHLM